jgi:hypothetical protein
MNNLVKNLRLYVWSIKPCEQEDKLYTSHTKTRV